MSSTVIFYKYAVAYPALGFLAYGAYMGYKRPSYASLLKSISHGMLSALPVEFMNFMMVSSLIGVITL